MNTILRYALGRRSPAPPWNDIVPVRVELFGVERLEQHAQGLATAQPVTTRPRAVLSLHTRLNGNAAVLLAAYRASTAELESGRGVVPAAEWLLDNYHLVENQVREIRDDLPADYYRQLPKLSEGPFAGYPRSAWRTHRILPRPLARCPRRCGYRLCRRMRPRTPGRGTHSLLIRTEIPPGA